MLKQTSHIQLEITNHKQKTDAIGLWVNSKHTWKVSLQGFFAV